jgi:mono/diheme cytochrome c family protein
VQTRFTPLTRWSLWLVAAAGLALGAATAAGACTPAPDNIDLGTGGAGGESGGGDTGGAAPNNGKALFAALEGDLYKACGSCHDAGGIADTPFLAGPDIYATIVSWPGLVVQDAAESKLLTYPVAGPQHTYKKLDSDTYKDTLYPAVKAWLIEEGKNIVTTTLDAAAGKLHIEPFAPIIGFNAVYLDALGADYTGMALTFNAVLVDQHVLELDELEVHPTAALGVHLVHPLFSVYPIKKENDPDPVDSLSNVDQSFESGQAGTLGPGTLILTNWQKGAKLSVAFEKIEPITPPVDAGADGGPEGGCKDVASFNTNAAGLLKQNCQGCHGGQNPQAQGAVDMSALASDPAAACSQIKNRVTPANATASQLFITTDPGGNAAHPFKFGGDGGKFNAFKQSVSQWISAEK